MLGSLPPPPTKAADFPRPSLRQLTATTPTSPDTPPLLLPPTITLSRPTLIQPLSSTPTPSSLTTRTGSSDPLPSPPSCLSAPSRSSPDPHLPHVTPLFPASPALNPSPASPSRSTGIPAEGEMSICVHLEDSRIFKLGLVGAMRKEVRSRCELRRGLAGRDLEERSQSRERR